MVICISGAKDIGKFNLAKDLQQHFYFRTPVGITPVHISHYSGFKPPTAYNKTISKIHYKDGFEIIKGNNLNDRIMIYSGFHIDEYVYGSKIRGYNTDFIFDLEKEFKQYLNQTFYILLTSNKSEDNKLFKDAFAKSIMPHKRYINTDKSTREEITQKAIAFMKEL